MNILAIEMVIDIHNIDVNKIFVYETTRSFDQLYPYNITSLSLLNLVAWKKRNKSLMCI
jgi:hypothetical protein